MSANFPFKKLMRWAFLFFLVLLLVSFFKKSSYRTVTEILPEIVRAPVQTEIFNTAPITFSKSSFDYKATPLYNYEITGLIAHALTYDKWYSISRTDEVFTRDLCILWGDNLNRRTYTNSSLHFSQDYRFCNYRYGSGVEFKPEQMSNNHLMTSDSLLRKKILKVSAGDQIRIIGKLVNVEAKAQREIQKYEVRDTRWNTSITRQDTGAGACEVIYVEDIEVLKGGNPVWRTLYTVSLYSLTILFLLMFLNTWIQTSNGTRIRH